jgi:hypothetical protein
MKVFINCTVFVRPASPSIGHLNTMCIRSVFCERIRHAWCSITCTRLIRSPRVSGLETAGAIDCDWGFLGGNVRPRRLDLSVASDLAYRYQPADGIIHIKTIEYSVRMVPLNSANLAFRTGDNVRKFRKSAGFPFNHEPALFPYDTMLHFRVSIGEA